MTLFRLLTVPGRTVQLGTVLLVRGQAVQLRWTEGRAGDTMLEAMGRRNMNYGAAIRSARLIDEDDAIEDANDEADNHDKENEQSNSKQWKRLRKPKKGDSGAQATTFSAKKVKASERANKLRQSSLLEHYSSTPSLTPPVVMEEPLEFTPDPSAASLPPPALSTPAPSRTRAGSKSTLTSTPVTAPALFATSSASSTSISPPARPAATTISIASRRGLVDITNTVNSRQRPPATNSVVAKQPSNGWRTKRRKGDDGTEWEESPPGKRVDAGSRQQQQQQRSSSGSGTAGVSLRRSAANVGSLGRRAGRAERDIVVLDATQDPDG